MALICLYTQLTIGVLEKKINYKIKMSGLSAIFIND